MLSDEQMAAIRERAAIVGDKVWDVPDGDMNGRILAIGPIDGYDGDALGFREGDPTIEFIAHSPADVHALLAEVAALRERVGEAEAERDIAVVNREQAYRLNSAANLREQEMADELEAAEQWMRVLTKMAADEIAAEKGDS